MRLLLQSFATFSWQFFATFFALFRCPDRYLPVPDGEEVIVDHLCLADLLPPGEGPGLLVDGAERVRLAERVLVPQVPWQEKKLMEFLQKKKCEENCKKMTHFSELFLMHLKKLFKVTFKEICIDVP